ncbi:hypothetical protein [Bradyrhizobium cytisi]|uniref:CopG family transcriptional regulator n=1 Tax=Bradyrhizobium cytisi TaxID=515489 RepID=A0A5S4WSP2_9BRAD|nr:hypothetical protein [Bradyrhizobium cytisi]TYL83616.1 hypothetical protein FXB38_18140 [Bradyrhizobium cytisi]
MTKAPNKQRSVRFAGDLEQQLEQMAELEGRTFSGQVTWLLRQALAARAFTPKSQQRGQHAA